MLQATEHASRLVWRSSAHGAPSTAAAFARLMCCGRNGLRLITLEAPLDDDQVGDAMTEDEDLTADQPPADHLGALHCLRMRSAPLAWALAAPRLAVLQATGPAIQTLPVDIFASGADAGAAARCMISSLRTSDMVLLMLRRPRDATVRVSSPGI